MFVASLRNWLVFHNKQQGLPLSKLQRMSKYEKKVWKINESKYLIGGLRSSYRVSMTHACYVFFAKIVVPTILNQNVYLYGFRCDSQTKRKTKYLNKENGEKTYFLNVPSADAPYSMAKAASLTSSPAPWNHIKL